MDRRELWRQCVEMHAKPDMSATCDACLYLPEVYARMEELEAGVSGLHEVLKEVIEAGGEIRCYPSGAVGFDEWYDAQAKAQAVLNEFLDEEGNWHPITESSEPIGGPNA